MGQIQSTATAAIAESAALSGAVWLGDKVLCGIIMPAAWTAADITFQFSVDNGTTWYDLLDPNGNEMKLASPAAGKAYVLDPSDFSAVQELKVRSGVTASAVNQEAARSLTLITRKYFPSR